MFCYRNLSLRDSRHTEDRMSVIDRTEQRPLDVEPALVTSRTDHDQPSVFLPESMLRETRRQRGLSLGIVPPVCVLDPDGDIARSLHANGGRKSTTWACYHSEMWESTLASTEIGVVGCAVGAPYAVLVAEQCFASGCRLLISITSAGQIADDLPAQGYILIDRALRGEGTSHCYLPPADTVDADPVLIERVSAGLADIDITVQRGTTWTTDAPYRETASAINHARASGALAVEMEAAALYALGQSKSLAVACLAHVTNQMGQIDGDFDKGHNAGAREAIRIIDAIAGAVLPAL